MKNESRNLSIPGEENEPRQLTPEDISGAFGSQEELVPIEPAEQRAESFESNKQALQDLSEQTESRAAKKGYDGPLSKLARAGRFYVGTVLLSLVAAGCSAKSETKSDSEPAATAVPTNKIEALRQFKDREVKAREKNRERIRQRTEEWKASEAAEMERQRKKAEKEVSEEEIDEIGAEDEQARQGIEVRIESAPITQEERERAYYDEKYQEYRTLLDERIKGAGQKNIQRESMAEGQAAIDTEREEIKMQTEAQKKADWEKRKNIENDRAAITEFFRSSLGIASTENLERNSVSFEMEVLDEKGQKVKKIFTINPSGFEQTKKYINGAKKALERQEFGSENERQQSIKTLKKSFVDMMQRTIGQTKEETQHKKVEPRKAEEPAPTKKASLAAEIKHSLDLINEDKSIHSRLKPFLNRVLNRDILRAYFKENPDSEDRLIKEYFDNNPEINDVERKELEKRFRAGTEQE